MWQLLHLDTIHRAVPEKMSRTFSHTIGREREEAILNETAETIKGLFRDGGNVGGSIGILSGGKQALLSIGTRDTSPSRLPPDDHTVYLISSMTKPILGLAMAVLVNDSRYNISFDTTVKEVLPRLERKSFLCHANRELTIGDLLDHNSEFLRTTNLWESPCGAVPWQTEDPIVSLLEHLSLNAKYSKPSSFAYGRNYSNECFALAAAIIERTTGMPWARFVKERVLQPLDMWFTFPDVTREEQQSQGNFAGTYSVRVDGTLRELREQIGEYKDLSYQTIHKYLEGWPHEPESIEVLPSQASRQTIMGAAAGIMSCVSDLLIFYKKFLAIYNLDEQTRKTAGHKLSEIERAMLTQQDYITSKATNFTCVYAGGW
jgi:CubicO group peptidase (beta-lactamase class C family)